MRNTYQILCSALLEKQRLEVNPVDVRYRWHAKASTSPIPSIILQHLLSSPSDIFPLQLFELQPSTAMSPSLTLGFQALILCGPGVSLNTFTSKPDDFPKCLIQVANRPMVYYPIEFCRRTGITGKHLLPSSLK